MTAPEPVPHEHEVCCADVLSALWAKDPHDIEAGTLPYAPTPHLLDASLAMEALWGDWLRPGLRTLIVDALGGDDLTALDAMRLVAGLHDIGKVNPLFQLPVWGSGNPWHRRHEEHLFRHGLPEPAKAVVSQAEQMKHGQEAGLGVSVARRHEHVGGYWLHGAPLEDCHVDSTADAWLAVAVAGHHGRWRSPEDQGAVPGRDDYWLLEQVGQQGWREAAQRQQDLIEGALGTRVADTPPLTGPRAGVALVLISGLVMVADWIASGDEFVAAGKQRIEDGMNPIADPEGWLAARRSDMTEQMSRTLLSRQPLSPTVADLLGDRAPRPLQEAADAVGAASGLWIAAFPTGEGKTIAALVRHAHRADEHLIFALPTTATTDAMHKTLGEKFGVVTKSHGFASLEDPADTWFNSSVRRLLSPIATTTCDQVLGAALRQKNAAMRLLAVANHHLVLDEVHTFDAYQRTLLVELLSWLGATDSRVTLLSASIPREDAVAYRNAYAHGIARDKKRSLDVPFQPAYPAHWLSTDVEHVVGGPAPSGTATPTAAVVADAEFLLKPSNDLSVDRAAWAATAAAQHPQCHIAVVCNRVNDAIETARRVQGLLGDSPSHDVVVLHSRMTRSQRASIESRLVRDLGPDGAPSRPLLVIATQIIEASLDIDFDLMATDLAPSPSLVQRAGRLWRFRDDALRRARFGALPSRREVAVFYVTTKQGAMSKVGCLPYTPAELTKVLGMLTASPVLRVPEDIQAFVDGGRISWDDLVDIDEDDFGADDDFSAMVERDLGAQMTRVTRANDVRSELHKHLVCSKAPTYSRLTHLTRLPDDEEAARTRFVEMPSDTFILFDSRPGSAAALAGFVVAAPVPAHAQKAPAHVVRQWQAATLPASGAAREQLLRLHQLTMQALGIEDWDLGAGRMSSVLRRQRPVDLALIETAAAVLFGDGDGGDTGCFDVVFGWTTQAL